MWALCGLWRRIRGSVGGLPWVGIFCSWRLGMKDFLEEMCVVLLGRRE
jgi:hypothetical protein